MTKGKKFLIGVSCLFLLEGYNSAVMAYNPCFPSPYGTTGKFTEQSDTEESEETLPAVKRFLERLVKFRYKSLGDAAASGNLSVVQDFIASGADVDSQLDKYGRTPLMAASYHGELRVVRELLRSGADINRVNQSVPPASSESNPWAWRPLMCSWTPLMGAVSQHRSSIVKELLKGGADPFVRARFHDGREITAHGIISRDLKSDVCPLSVKKWKRIQDLLPSPIFQAIHDHNLEEISKLIRADRNVLQEKFMGETPVEYVRRKWSHLLKVLESDPAPETRKELVEELKFYPDFFELTTIKPVREVPEVSHKL